MAKRVSSDRPVRPTLSPEQTRRCIQRLEARIQELENFDPAAVQKRGGDPAVMALEASIADSLAAAFGNRTAEYNRYSRAASLDNGPWVMDANPFGGGGHRDDTAAARQYIAEGKVASVALLRSAIRSLTEEIEGEVGSESPPVREAAGPPTKVFVVHGRDDGPKQAVARFVEKLGFEAVILHERPNRGRTIITKFREEAADVGFAVVLMTPDDLGGLTADTLQNRARQNVVFELGFFIGALGPHKVAALVQGDIERPSDFDGVVYISLDNAHWQAELGRELKEAGFAIDWNKVMG